jgi:FkbM family methyltransferase
MSWKEPWPLKLRRRFQKPYNKIFHRERYFMSRYFGADFLLRPDGIGTLELSAKIAEHTELSDYLRRCAELRPDVFIDIGANIGLYSCILLRNNSVSRAVLFEPDRRNLVHLRANLLINGLLDRVEVHESAVGDAAGLRRFSPGKIDGGFSRIVGAETVEAEYDVHMVRLDEALSLENLRLAIKIDVEHSECEVINGMQRTLRQNRCLVQIEAFETRDKVISTMAAAGYHLVADFSPNFVFENPSAQARR